MSFSFWCSLEKKGKSNDNQQPLSKKPKLKYEIQSLSDLAMFTNSVLSHILGKKVKHSQSMLCECPLY